jgi:hypothetical protein
MIDSYKNKVGAGMADRTPNLSVKSRWLYQLSYTRMKMKALWGDRWESNPSCRHHKPKLCH